MLGLWELAGPTRDNFMGNLYPLLWPSQGSTDKLLVSVVKVYTWQKEAV